MTAQLTLATLTKDGIIVVLHATPDYEEKYSKNLTKIPKPVIKDNREKDPAVVDYEAKNKPTIIDLGISPTRSLTLKGYILTETGTQGVDYTSTHGTAMDKKNDLRRMCMNGGNIAFTLETGGIYTFFQNVIMETCVFTKIPTEGQESINDGIAEYSFIITLDDANEHGT
jgi:hypothetical protein